MSNPYSTLKAIVVDDHMMMRTMIRQHLESLGFKDVETANDGKDALDKINHASSVGSGYDIVFLDWHMPNVEGIEVLKICRAKPEFNKTAFIMLTAEQEEKNVLKAIQAGSTSYLVKPVAKDALEKNLVKVIAWLEKQGYDFKSASEKKTLLAEMNKPHHISHELQKKLAPVISKGVKNIFSELFHTDIMENHQITEDMKKQMVCIGRLQQEDIIIDLRFFFEKGLLKPLLVNLYSPEFLNNDGVFEDAACEIVNILCGQIKAFMNKNGYALNMTVPQMGINDSEISESDALVNVCFSFNKDQCFLIDLDTNKNS